jgi:hypothetical protein
MERALLRDEQGNTVGFQFNPETISFTKAAQWSESTSRSSSQAPPRQFVGTKAIELGLKMLLDEASSTGETVEQRVNQLLGWMNPAEGSNPPAPHALTFKWGELKIGIDPAFECYLDSVAVEYTMFTTTGLPTRANATVKLVALPTPTGGQNPTSGALRPMRSQQLLPGDDLAVLAHRHYGDTRHWRAVAELNGIDNPFRLPTGQELVLPLQMELDE